MKKIKLDIQKFAPDPPISGVLIDQPALYEYHQNIKTYYAQKTDLPTKTSDLTNDSGYITSYTETDPIFSASAASGISSSDITNWNNKSNFSGSYNDLTNKPSIPSKTSDLTNDSDYITSSALEDRPYYNSQYTVQDESSLGYYEVVSDFALDNSPANAYINSDAIKYKLNDNLEDIVDGKQATLVSGTNIKTINNQSLLGSGNITISSGGGGTQTDVQINGSSIVSNDVANILVQGSYSSSNKIATMSEIPTVPTNISSFTNDSGYITNSVNNLTNYTPTSSLSSVATSGSYNDLSNTPTIPTNSSIVDLIYPVGSIYMSTNSTTPATLFGGTWERIQGRFLLAGNDAYEEYQPGATGGAVTKTTSGHTHSLNTSTAAAAVQLNTGGSIDYGEMSSTSNIPKTYSITGTGGKGAANSKSNKYGAKLYGNTASQTDTVNVMPPFLAVYVWERTA